MLVICGVCVEDDKCSDVFEVEDEAQAEAAGWRNSEYGWKCPRAVELEEARITEFKELGGESGFINSGIAKLMVEVLQKNS